MNNIKIFRKSMIKEIRTMPIDKVDEELRTVEGYGAVFDSQSRYLGFYETIHRGAITEDTIKKSVVLACLNHNDDKVLARSKFGEGSLELTVDEKGLFYRFTLPKTRDADELIEYIKRGDIDSSSFAFTLIDDEEHNSWKKENGEYYRDIYLIDELFDVSPVFNPAYASTTCSARNNDDEKLFDEKRAALDAQEQAKKDEISKVLDEKMSDLDKYIIQ